jgi:hypothetical protein
LWWRIGGFRLVKLVAYVVLLQKNCRLPCAIGRVGSAAHGMIVILMQQLI